MPKEQTPIHAHAWLSAAVAIGLVLVFSAAFADACACDWADLGEFPIAGFSKAQRVFGLQDEAGLDAAR